MTYGPEQQGDPLFTPPSASEELTQQLAASGRPRATWLTAILVAIVIGVGGFAGGVFFGKNNASANNTGQQTAGQGGGRQFPGGAQRGQGGGGNFGNFVTGTVERVEGNTVVIKQPDGTEVKVTTTDTTTVTLSQQGKVTDLKPGQSVIARGEAGTDGTVSAQTINEGQLGAGFGGRGVFPGGSPRPTPTG